jgi:exodeoxyribonuclease-3
MRIDDSHCKPLKLPAKIGMSRSERLPPVELLKIVTWNVASLRAAWEHGFELWVKHASPDILCLQETKMSTDAKPSVESMKISGYRAYFLHAKKKGYSGTAIYTKFEPLSIRKSDGISDPNGRCITAEFDTFFLVNTYVVNAGSELENLETKMTTFLPQLEAHIRSLRQKKRVIWTGDLNVAHQDIDIWEPDGHEKIAGFTPEERTWFGAFLGSGYKDVFRSLYPDKQQFSFFNFRGNERARNRGWRIDYFIVSEDIMNEEGLVYDCTIDMSADFSDHCPVVLLLDRAKIITGADKEVTGAAVEVLGAPTSLMSFFSVKPKVRAASQSEPAIAEKGPM